ncbi:MAG: sugar ABC transporter permease [Candidatus Omnitrophica bacterium]|nr:sugar ABC transporter permease [Candidatus Omnitrophica bacterium COP1]MCL4735245.1 sugar ABC transporter permease [Candidatus Omnitrophota bacterium]
MSLLEKQQRRFAFWAILPAFLLFSFWVAWPALKGFQFALSRWDGLTPPVPVGLGNFREMFDAFLNPDAGPAARMLPIAFQNNLILMIFPMIIILSISLFFASAFRKGIAGASLFRVAFFFPNILSSVAVSVLWMLLYSTSSFGVFNSILGSLNQVLIQLGWVDRPLVSTPFEFTNSAILAWSLIPMIVWTATGFYMLLFLAAMQSIPDSLYEAATVDGASHFTQFRCITFPLIRDTVVTGMVFLLLGGLKIFDQVWVIEQQQSRPDSNTLATLMYSKVFNEYQVGYGTAIAVFLFILVLVFSLATLRLYRREALEFS